MEKKLDLEVIRELLAVINREGVEDAAEFVDHVVFVHAPDLLEEVERLRALVAALEDIQ